MFNAQDFQFLSLQPEAVNKLGRDIRRSLRATLRAKSSPPPDEFLKSSETFLGTWSDYEETSRTGLPNRTNINAHNRSHLSHFYRLTRRIISFKNSASQGFKNTLQFHTPGDMEVRSVLAMCLTHDPVADWVKAAEVLKSASFLPRLTTATVEGSL
ncbi:hypothetical protein IW262DRAFT_1468628 [Armillaria fumosa]|nr:hypothetical protein IW262DRAFT_1468628 [Armillaria fumosa]